MAQCLFKIMDGNQSSPSKTVVTKQTVWARGATVDRPQTRGSSVVDQNLVTGSFGANIAPGHANGQNESRGVKRSSVRAAGQARSPAPSNRQSFGVGSMLTALDEGLRQSETASPVKKLPRLVSKTTVQQRGQDPAERFIASLVDGDKHLDFKHMDNADVKSALTLLKVSWDANNESKEELRAKLIGHVKLELCQRLATEPDILTMRKSQLGLSSPSPLKKSLGRLAEKVRQSADVSGVGQRHNQDTLFPKFNGHLYCPQIKNEGNTCYAIQVLASLLSLETFQAIVLQHLDKPPVALLLELAQLKPSAIGSTFGVRQCLSRINATIENANNYMLGTQQDAVEFLRDLMDNLVMDPKTNTEFVDLKEELKKTFLYEDTSTFKCSSGGDACDLRTVPPVEHYPVTTVALDGRSLQHCFDNEEKYREWGCFNCSSTNCERTKRRPDKLPKIWIVQLKRFSYDGRAGKLSQKIDVPLTWQPFGPLSAAYQLRAVTIHRGVSLGSGHYWGLTICPSGQMAYKMDDAALPEKVGYIIFWILFFQQIFSFSGPGQC